MQLALPRFAMAEGPRYVHPPWPVMSESPAFEPDGATRGRGLPLFDGPYIVFISVLQPGRTYVILERGFTGCEEMWGLEGDDIV